jgi:hypothetical protein
VIRVMLIQSVRSKSTSKLYNYISDESGYASDTNTSIQTVSKIVSVTKLIFVVRISHSSSLVQSSGCQS